MSMMAIGNINAFHYFHATTNWTNEKNAIKYRRSLHDASSASANGQRSSTPFVGKLTCRQKNTSHCDESTIEKNLHHERAIFSTRLANGRRQ